MAILGGGDFTFELSGDDWGELPEGWTYADATAVAVDSSDNVYVFNRGGHPVIVYDSAGRFLRSWGEDIFTNPHGIAVGPDDSVYCVDSADHTVRKFTTEGELLLTLGQKGDPARAMSGDPFRAPTHVAVDPRNSYYYRALGVVLHRRGDAEGAIQQFSRAIKVSPRGVTAYVNRAEVHISRRDFRTALKDLDAAIRTARDTSDPIVRKANALRILLMRR